MLHKPQTLNDIKARTARIVEFSDIKDLQQSINNMIEREIPLVVLTPKGSGRREDR
jgi:uncharacterized protein YceH (UPF0502 family)